jgi:sarcosine oxidase gamma subunit
LAKEAARVLKVLESKNSIMSLKPIDIAIFKPIGSQGTDLLKLEVHIQRVALDVHPVVKFKDYFEVFGNDLQKGKQHRHINFPTFDGNLKFRIS